MRTLLLVLLFLAGCGGGGGGGFTPSANVQTTHPYLIGSWVGYALSARSPGERQLTAEVTTTTDPAVLDCAFSISNSPCFNSADGSMRAGGSTVLLSSYEISATCRVVSEDRLEGSYSVSVGPCSGDTGTVVLLRRPSSPALIDVTTFEAPGFWLQIRQAR